jgi:hypothetical protein
VFVYCSELAFRKALMKLRANSIAGGFANK